MVFLVIAAATGSAFAGELVFRGLDLTAYILLALLFLWLVILACLFICPNQQDEEDSSGGSTYREIGEA